MGVHFQVPCLLRSLPGSQIGYYLMQVPMWYYSSVEYDTQGLGRGGEWSAILRLHYEPLIKVMAVQKFCFERSVLVMLP